MTTSINFHYRPSGTDLRRPGRLFIRVIRSRQSRQLSCRYTLYASEWDPSSGNVIVSAAGTDPDRSSQLRLIDESVRRDRRRLQEIVEQLGSCGDFSASDVLSRFSESLNGNTVLGYCEIVSNRLRAHGRDRTARAYRSAVRSLMNFKGGKDVFLSDIDSQLMTEYEQYLLARGLKLNTVSFYLRNLRALYFRATSESVIPRQSVNPFSGVHTGVYETRRRALDDSQLKALARLEEVLSGNLCSSSGEACTDSVCASCMSSDSKEGSTSSVLHDSLLYFLFCYHARGMSFVDMAHLRHENIGNETLTYRRRKTGGLLEVTITEPMRRILSHFGQRGEGSEFVFPVIDSRRFHTDRQYETGLKRQNRSLKILAGMAGITESLSTHAARHTWATLAKRLNVPVAVIGEALGHRDVKTTTIYLASFDRSTMDELSVMLSEAAQAA